MSLYFYSLYFLYSSGVYPFAPEDPPAALAGFGALAVVVLAFDTLAGTFSADLAFILAGDIVFLFLIFYACFFGFFATLFTFTANVVLAGVLFLVFFFAIYVYLNCINK